jgi:hypothetical protein
MILNSNLLTPNTCCYLKPIDAIWCQNTKQIAQYNWCKIVNDNLREVGQKWKMHKKLGMEKHVLCGCYIFLIVSALGYYTLFSQFQYLTPINFLGTNILMNTQIFYLDNLIIPNGVDTVATPRCALYT